MNPKPQNSALKRIGLFDSGVGGLSILRYLQEKSAQNKQDLKFVYLGDTGRCPYGDRSPDEISSFVEEIIDWFNGAGVDRIIMACNTSAAIAAPLARRLAKVPVHDLISSASQFAAANFKSVGVLATSATCRSNAFSRAIKSHNSNIRVCEIACPDLVPMVERGVLSGPEVDATISKYVQQLKDFGADSLIFGCTHFPFLDSAFRQQLGESIAFIDPAVHLGDEVLGATVGSANTPVATAAFQRNTYFCSGELEPFARAAELCLNLSSGSLKEAVCSLSWDDQRPRANCQDSNERTVILQSPFFHARSNATGQFS